ncbi:hypothetical protein MMC22_003942 [Lobaria immixta]|nr:hypothetical protein [Lobaria immixta]
MPKFTTLRNVPFLDRPSTIQTALVSTSRSSLSLTSSEATTSSSSRTTTVSAASSSTLTCLPTIPPLTCYRFRTDFPSIDKWISWDCPVSLNKPTLLVHNRPDEADVVIAGVEAVAKKAGIDPRVAFAVAMQESNGMVRSLSRNFNSFGIFQVPILEAASCDGTEVNECLAEIITEMAENGIYGHNGTVWRPRKPGLAYWIATQKDIALGLRERGYVSDIANRLVRGKFGARSGITC